jgi:uncharacterized protein (UPF0335 family)
VYIAKDYFENLFQKIKQVEEEVTDLCNIAKDCFENLFQKIKQVEEEVTKLMAA